MTPFVAEIYNIGFKECGVSLTAIEENSDVSGCSAITSQTNPPHSQSSEPHSHHQQWYFVRASFNDLEQADNEDTEEAAAYGVLYVVINVATGKALDVEGANEKEFGRIHIYDCNESAAQVWRWVPCGDGYGRLVNPNSGLALTYHGSERDGRVATATIDDAQKSRQALVLYLAAPVSEVKRDPVPRVAPSYLLVSPNDATEDLAMTATGLRHSSRMITKKVHKSLCSPKQSWYFRKAPTNSFGVEKHVYTIQNAVTGLCLDVEGGDVESSGARIILWPFNLGANQFWEWESEDGDNDDTMGRLCNPLHTEMNLACHNDSVGLFLQHSPSNSAWRLTPCAECKEEVTKLLLAHRNKNDQLIHWKHLPGSTVTRMSQNCPEACQATNVFDGCMTTKWAVKSNSATIEYQLDSVSLLSLTGYEIVSSSDDQNSDPSSWTVQAYSTGLSRWITLDSQDDEIFPERSTSQKYAIDSALGHGYFDRFRWIFMQNYSMDVDLLEICQLNFFGKTPATVNAPPVPWSFLAGQANSQCHSLNDAPVTNLFDMSSSTEFVAQNLGEDPTITYALDSDMEMQINGYDIVSASHNREADASAWTFGVTLANSEQFVELDTKANQVFERRSEIQYYPLQTSFTGKIRNFCFKLHNTTSDQPNGIQLCQLRLYGFPTFQRAAQTILPWADIPGSMTCTRTSSLSETATNVLTGELDHKWVADKSRVELLYCLDEPARLHLKGYEFVAGNDCRGRDPKRWKLDAFDEEMGKFVPVHSTGTQDHRFYTRSQPHFFNVDSVGTISRLRWTFLSNHGAFDGIQLCAIKLFGSKEANTTTAPSKPSSTEIRIHHSVAVTPPVELVTSPQTQKPTDSNSSLLSTASPREESPTMVAAPQEKQEATHSQQHMIHQQCDQQEIYDEQEDVTQTSSADVPQTEISDPTLGTTTVGAENHDIRKVANPPVTEHGRKASRRLEEFRNMPLQQRIAHMKHLRKDMDALGLA